MDSIVQQGGGGDALRRKLGKHCLLGLSQEISWDCWSGNASADFMCTIQHHYHLRGGQAGTLVGVVLLVLAVHPPRQMHPTALWLGHNQFMCI